MMTRLCSLLCSVAFGFGLAAKEPNILFAFADDWGRQAGIYAKVDGTGTINDVTRTPNFDRLAQRGVLFANASVNAPSCTPCRSSILSGRNFWETGRGAILQGAIWDETIPTWPLLLRVKVFTLTFSFLHVTVNKSWKLGSYLVTWRSKLPIASFISVGKCTFLPRTFSSHREACNVIICIHG